MMADPNLQPDNPYARFMPLDQQGFDPTAVPPELNRSPPPAAEPNAYTRFTPQEPLGSPPQQAPPAQGLVPAAPPALTAEVRPPPAPGPYDVQTWPDYNPDQELKLGLDKETEIYRNKPVSFLTGAELPKPSLIDPGKDARLIELNELRKMAATLTDRRERTQTNTLLNQTEARIQREIRDKNAALQNEYNKRRSEHLARADAPFKDPVQRENIAALSKDKLDRINNYYTTGVHPSGDKARNVDMTDPQKRFQQEYTRNTSPLATLEPDQLRDIVTSILMRNPELSSEAAVNYALSFGSPTPGAVGRNKVRGKGGTNYEVVGRDDFRGDWIVSGEDGREIRIDKTSFALLHRGRIKGYDTAIQMLAKRRQAIEDAKKDDWLTRQTKGALDYLGVPR